VKISSHFLKIALVIVLIYASVAKSCFAGFGENSQIIKSVLKTTHGKAVRLIVGVAVDSRVARVEFPSPSIRRRALSARPEVAVARQIVERTISIPIASRQ